MELKESKNIKVYGTLVNDTVGTITDNSHNDALANAYQLYDGRFGAGGTEDYQDRINKRLTGITYDPNSDTTTIDNNLIVTGDTNLKGDLKVDGDSIFEGPVTFKDDVNIQGDIDLDISLNDLSDVALSATSVGQALYYDGSKWVNKKLSIGDILMPNATAGQVLKYINGQWVAATDEGGASKLSDLDDVDSSVDNAADGSVLKYDETSGKWKAVDESGTPSSDGYIYRTQYANLVKVKSMFSGSEVASSSAVPSTTFGIIYPNNRYTDVYVSNDIILLDGESIYSSTITQLPTERGQKIFNSGVAVDDGLGQWTMTGNGQSYTWTVHSDGYAISPGTRKNTTPIKAYSTASNALYSLSGGAFNPDITIGTINFNNYTSGPNFSTDVNYNPAYDSSLRSTKHFLAIPSGSFVLITSQSNYKQDLKITYTFAYEILSNGTIETYAVLPTGYKELYTNTHPYDWLTTDFYKAVVRDDRSGTDYTSISESTAKSKMTFVDVPYGLCYASIRYDNSCITMPNTLPIKVVTRKPAS